MRHIRTYEGFLNKIWNKITSVSDHGDLLNADFNNEEIKKLEELGFEMKLLKGE